MKEIGIKDIVDAMMEAAKFPQRARNKGEEGRWLPEDKKNLNDDTTVMLKDVVNQPISKVSAGLIISGKMSSGKTAVLGRLGRMIAMARAPEFKKRYDGGDEPDVPIYYLPAHEGSVIMNNIYDARTKRAYTDLHRVEVLFVDDIDKLIHSFLNERGRGMLDSLLRNRFNEDLLTVIASGTPTDELDGPESMVSFLEKMFFKIEIRSSFPEENGHE